MGQIDPLLFCFGCSFVGGKGHGGKTNSKVEVIFPIQFVSGIAFTAAAHTQCRIPAVEIPSEGKNCTVQQIVVHIVGDREHPFEPFIKCGEHDRTIDGLFPLKSILIAAGGVQLCQSAAHGHDGTLGIFIHEIVTQHELPVFGGCIGHGEGQTVDEIGGDPPLSVGIASVHDLGVMFAVSSGIQQQTGCKLLLVKEDMLIYIDQK